MKGKDASTTFGEIYFTRIDIAAYSVRLINKRALFSLPVGCYLLRLIDGLWR